MPSLSVSRLLRLALLMAVILGVSEILYAYRKESWDNLNNIKAPIYNSICPERSDSNGTSDPEYLIEPPVPVDNLHVNTERDFRCKDVPIHEGLVVAVKTAATECFEKMPAQLMTALHCVKDLLVYSDLEQHVGEHAIHDALYALPEVLRKGNPDFKLYQRLQQYQITRSDILSMVTHEDRQATWELDKYKNLPMAQEVYKLYPEKEWYFFMDADTYVVWPSITAWLKRLDPSVPLYLGAPRTIKKKIFGHGGSGYILSQAGMKQFIGNVTDTTLTKMHNDLIKEECCGDYVLARMLEKKGIGLSNHWPMLSSDKPSTIPFGPTHWCQPVVTMSQMEAEDVSGMWRFEQGRADPNKPLLYRELFAYAMPQHLFPEREQWDNLSDDIMYYSPTSIKQWHQPPRDNMTKAEINAWGSFAHCRTVCDLTPDCFQFFYDGEACGLSKSFKMGRKRVPESEDGMYKSGWNLKRWELWRTKNVCSYPEWVTPDHQITLDTY